MTFIQRIDVNILYLMAFGVAFFITMMVTPISKKIAIKFGAIDHPKERGVHVIPTPLAGGSAIVFSFVITSLVLIPLMKGYISKEFFGIILAGILITTVGFLDDVYQLSPRIRIFFQVLAALIVVFTGTTIEWLSWPWAESGLISLHTLGNFMTVFWIVGLTNAMNFIDGLDGLAAGVASIAAISFMVISFIFGPPASVMMAAILSGACLGFLPHNFSPATIFMGDTGSTFLGFMLAVMSIQGLTKGYTVITLVVGAIVLGLPIFDTSFAILRRVAKKQSIAQADRGHLHHRLVDKGISHRRAVLTMYAVAGAFGIAGVLFALKDFLLATIIIIIILVVWIVDLVATHRRDQGKAREIEDKK